VTRCSAGCSVAGVLWQAPPPAPPPPLAFRTATLNRDAHAIDVRLMAVARVAVRVTISRHGHRLGRGAGAFERGTTDVRIRIGPKAIKPLRRGLHVDVAIEYGPPAPLRARTVLLVAPSGDDDDDDLGLAT
jgi:hypothetical protein